MIKKKLFIVFSVLLLVYMLWPGSSIIFDFKPLPSSSKSALAGDNVEQVPNVAAYFSDNFRDFVVPFYRSVFQNLSRLPFPPLRLNHPPEYSWNVIKRHTDSTYIEELVYPLRGSLYINGYEPFYPNGNPKFWGSTKFDADGQYFYTKTTIRYYPSNVMVRILVWSGITASVFLLFKVGKRILI